MHASLQTLSDLLTQGYVEEQAIKTSSPVNETFLFTVYFLLLCAAQMMPALLVHP